MNTYTLRQSVYKCRRMNEDFTLKLSHGETKGKAGDVICESQSGTTFVLAGAFFDTMYLPVEVKEEHSDKGKSLREMYEENARWMSNLDQCESEEYIKGMKDLNGIKSDKFTSNKPC